MPTAPVCTYTIVTKNDSPRGDGKWRKKKPKYKVGDTVVITLYGTVGKITAVKWLDGTYVYEINNSQGLFTEESLDL